MLKKNLIRITMLFLVSMPTVLATDVSMPTVLATDERRGSDGGIGFKKESSSRPRLQKVKSVNDINSPSASKLISLVVVKQKDNGDTGTDYNTSSLVESKSLDGKNSYGALSGNGSDNVAVITNLREKQDVLGNNNNFSERPEVDNASKFIAEDEINNVVYTSVMYRHTALLSYENSDEDDTKRELTSSPRLGGGNWGGGNWGGRNIDIDTSLGMDDNGSSSTLDRGGHSRVVYPISQDLLGVNSLGFKNLQQDDKSFNIPVPENGNRFNVEKSHKMPRNVLTFNDFIVMVAVAGIIVGAKWLYDKYYSPNKKERKNNRVSKNRTTKA